MVEYVVDFTGVKDFWGFYRVIIEALDFPFWCGRNADAIWDMLVRYMEYPDIIRFRGFNSLPRELDILKPKIKETFEDATTYYEDEHFEFIIES